MKHWNIYKYIRHHIHRVNIHHLCKITIWIHLWFFAFTLNNILQFMVRSHTNYQSNLLVNIRALKKMRLIFLSAEDRSVSSTLIIYPQNICITRIRERKCALAHSNKISLTPPSITTVNQLFIYAAHCKELQQYFNVTNLEEWDNYLTLTLLSGNNEHLQ